MSLVRATIVIAFAMWQPCAAEFLQKYSQNDTKLLFAVEAALGPGKMRTRVEKLEERLRPMFLSLPKNADGLLGHAAARYALHRINVDLHGWSINGLEPNASTVNTTSLLGSGLLRGIVPEHVEAIFKEQMQTDGFRLRDLAILASTIEHHVHADQQSMLLKACELFDLPTVGNMGEDHLNTVISFYKAMFLIGFDIGLNATTITAGRARSLLQRAPRAYPGWEDTVLFMTDERMSLTYNERHVANPFRTLDSSLEVAFRVVEKVADHYARHVAEVECQEIKEDLLTYERGDTGRIRLADFYRAGLESRFWYVERKEYLQAIGALDDSDMIWGPKVIVTNYVLAKSNCMAHSYAAYAICCINECEDLYGQIEQAVAAPEATPHRIASVVEDLSSATVQAPRNLSQELLGRLDDIASRTHGSVVLHSRLFAQFMHQAFPRECPYPHLTGTTTDLNPTEWSKENGMDYRIDGKGKNKKVELNNHIEHLDRELSFQLNDTEAANDADAEQIMWTSEEEHLVVPKVSFVRRAMSFFGSSVARGGLLLVAVLGAVSGFARRFHGAFGLESMSKCDSVYV